MRQKNNLNDAKGQISIMIGIMMSTFIFLFAFVINTGMLVNAKINLQNAADLAAYAGAAVQARQLTNISFLNYEMRRQWKKLLFRIYVIGNMAQDSFPRNGGVGPMQYQAGQQNYGIPTTCIIFNPQDNFCHIDTLKQIAIPPSSPLDAITETLRDQLSAIDQIRQNNCKTIGQTNKLLNIFWLFNTDPNLNQVQPGLGMTQDQIQAITIVRGLASGLGIVPRELILRQRIQTLNDYVNSKAQMGVKKAQIDQFINAIDPSTYERTIQAFYSAYYTLGNHTFQGDSVILDELLPGDSSAAALLLLKEIRRKFDTYAIDLYLSNNANQAAGSQPQDCTSRIFPIIVPSEFPVGVYKDPSVLTYYAIRVRAQAKILFSPFGTLDLKAYSAAKPFGSRIGPSFAEFVTTANMSSARLDTTGTLTGNLPNLPVKAQDGTAQGQGWDTQDMVSRIYQAISSGPGINLSLNAQSVQNAIQLAMSPNPWEATRYNIINDQGVDHFVRHFGIDGKAVIWAPLFTPDKRAQLSAVIPTLVKNLFPSPGGNFGAGGIAGIQAAISKGIENYINTTLSSDQGGEDGEGMNIVKITNPLPTNGPQVGSDPQYFLTDPKQLKSSWNSVNNGEYRQEGRVGYSVKFISFQNLTKKKLTTDGSSIWTNDLPSDGEADTDIPFIQH